MIGFDTGILLLALTPTFLDSEDNIVTTHRKKCNAAAELSLEDAMEYMMERGIAELPSFLPIEVHCLWEKLLLKDN
jgi:hypothetical protein